MRIDRRLIAHFDWGLFLSVMLVPLFGLVVLYSAGYDPEFKTTFISWLPDFMQVGVMLRQLTYVGLGLCVMLIAMSLPPGFLNKIAPPFYVFCVILLVAVDIFGTIANGSRRWLSLGGFNLQPSEPMKFALILMLARYFSKSPPKDRKGYGFLELIVPSLIILVPALLIIQQPDLGTGMVVLGIGFIMLVFVGIKWRPVLFAALVAIASAYPAWNSLHEYQQKRILTLIDPESDPLGSGYHIIQSKIAVGSGAFFGKGYMKGTQTQLEFLPEHTTDFIFSVLAEEWGFVGCVFLIMIYCLLNYRLLRVVEKSKDLFQSLIVFGVTAQIFMHTVINIGMVVGLFPVVGIPLPLFSYGGSSVLSTMFAIGIVLGVSMRRFVFAGG